MAKKFDKNGKKINLDNFWRISPTLSKLPQNSANLAQLVKNIIKDTLLEKINVFSAEKYGITRHKVTQILCCTATLKIWLIWRSTENAHILSMLKFAGPLLAFHGRNVHFRLISPYFFYLGYKYFF